MNQSELAKKLGVYPSHVSKWETGVNTISGFNASKLQTTWKEFIGNGPDGSRVIIGYDPDGSPVSQEEEARRIDDLDKISIRMQEEANNIETTINNGNKVEKDDELMLAELKADHAKALAKVHKIDKVKKEIIADPPFVKFHEVQKSTEQSLVEVKERLLKNLDELSSADNFDMDEIWETFKLNPKTMSDQDKIDFFNKTFSTAIGKVNKVLKETFEGPGGKEFRQKLKENLDKKSKEITQQFTSAQQDLIEKSSGRESEMANEIKHLQEKTRLLENASHTQMKLNETTNRLLEKTEATLARLETHLDASTEENKKIKAHVGRLDKALKKTAAWVDESNKYTDEEMEKMKQELIAEIEQARAYDHHY